MSKSHSAMFPEIHLERCSRYRFSYSQCQYCTDACPHAALQLSDKGVELDAGRCANCGLCASACPTDLFQASNIPLSELVAAKRDISVACLPSQIDAELTVPCLGALDAVVMSALAQRNIEVMLKGSTHCAQCSHAPQGEQMLSDMLAAVKALSQSVPNGSWKMARLADDIEPDKGINRERAGRRQFFRRFLSSGVAAAQVNEAGEMGEEHVIPETAIRSAAHHLPHQRKLLGKIIKEPESVVLSEAVALTLAVGVVIATDGCSGCEICARVCPTGALFVQEIDKEWQLHLYGDRCVGCGLCIEGCSCNAIELKPAIAAAGQERVIHTLFRYRCQGCGRYFVDDGTDSCPVCKDDAESFDSIFN